MSASDFASGRQSVGSTSKGVYVGGGIMTIDVSDVDESSFGHSSLFQTPDIARDLHYLLGQQLPPDKRHGLSLHPSGRCWRINK